MVVLAIESVVETPAKLIVVTSEFRRSALVIVGPDPRIKLPPIVPLWTVKMLSESARKKAPWPVTPFPMFRYTADPLTIVVEVPPTTIAFPESAVISAAFVERDTDDEFIVR